MSLKFALLGIIDTGNRPYSGYELKNIFDSSMHFYWNATYTQIYSTLSRMHGDGLLTMKLVHQDNHPNKKLYSITDIGQIELKNWVAKPFEIQKVRNAMLVQITLADRLDNDQVVAMLDAYIIKVRARLEILQSDGVQGILYRARNDRERFFWQFSIEKGVLTFERELDWAESMLAKFREQFMNE